VDHQPNLSALTQKEFIVNISLRKVNDQRHDSDLVKKSAIGAVVAAMTFAIPIFAIANASPRPAYLSQGTAQTVDNEDLLWWLPADTESVVAARGPFPILIELNKENRSEEREWFSKKASLSEIRLAFEQLPLELFNSLDLATPLRGTIVAFAMQGSRHFRDPLPGMEVMDYEGCSIVVFKDKLGERGENLLRVLAKKAAGTDIIAGTKVLVFHQKSEQAKWSYFMAVPRPDVLLAANNLPYLQEVLERMAQRKSPRALSDQLPEWRFLDPAARFWGLRHFDRSQAKLDPTSPFSAERTFGPGDEKAVGRLFVIDPINEQTAVFTYFTADEAAVRDSARRGSEVSEPQDGVKYEVKLRSPKPGVLERVYTLDRTSTLEYFILTVGMSLGRGMYF